MTVKESTWQQSSDPHRRLEEVEKKQPMVSLKLAGDVIDWTVRMARFLVKSARCHSCSQSRAETSKECRLGGQ